MDNATRPMTGLETVKLHSTPQVSAPSVPGTGDGSGQVRQITDLAFIAFIILHAPLAILLKTFPILSTTHALGAFAIGLWAVLLRPKDDLLHLWAATYIVAGEVLWRLTASGHLPHEFGKYGIIVIFGIAILRRYRRRPLPALPLVYLVCLLPALIFLVDFSMELALIRKRAFGMAGPFSLAICAIYFCNLELDSQALKRLAFIAIAPTVGMAAYIIFNIITLGDALRFGRSSNPMVTDGVNAGNQVSNILAFGAVFCWLLLSRASVTRLTRLVLLGAMGGLVVVAMFTFSRGGVFTFGLVVALTLSFVLKNNPNRRGMALMIILASLLAFLFIWPWFNQFTSGFAAERFSSLDGASRWELVQSQIQVWLDNPIFGVGPGMTKEEVVDYLGFALQTHTEYTRLLAEHGLYGLLALIVLIIGALKSYRRARYWEARVWVTALIVYAFAYMAQCATRTVTPGFTYGLAWACLFAQSQVGHPSRRAQSHARPVHHA